MEIGPLHDTPQERQFSLSQRRSSIPPRFAPTACRSRFDLRLRGSRRGEPREPKLRDNEPSLWPGAGQQELNVFNWIMAKTVSCNLF